MLSLTDYTLTILVFMCVAVTFWLSSRLMAKASWSCSSSSPLVWGRACSRSDAARGDEDEAADKNKRGSLREVTMMAWWRNVQSDVWMHETWSTGSVGLIWIFPGLRCDADNLRGGFFKVLSYSKNCISAGISLNTSVSIYSKRSRYYVFLITMCQMTKWNSVTMW